MEIVIDEWIIHFIEDPNKNGEVQQVLDRIYEKCDKLVTIENSPLVRKIYKLMKKAGDWKNITQLTLAKYFISSFVYNSNKFKNLASDELEPIPEKLEQCIPEDDVYLVKAAISTDDKTILTTDNKLKDRINQKATLKILLLEDFMKTIS